MKKMNRLWFGYVMAFVGWGALSPVGAQSVTPTVTPSTPTVAMDGLVDAYYSYNFDNAANHKVGSGNLGTYFDGQDGSYSLGLAEIKTTVTQGEASGHLVLAYGQELNLLPLTTGGSTNPGIDVEQAYVSYAPGLWTFSAGRFVTWMGNEVIESTSNWNISHSLLFWYTIPLLHDGVSVAYTPNSIFKATGYATNGWNVVNIGTTSTQTFGLSLAYTPNSIWSVTLNGVDGPGSQAGALNTISGSTASSRYIGEAIIGFNATSTWSFALDAEAGGANGVGTAGFWGADLYAKYAFSSNWSAALRLEELNDNGDTLGIYGTSVSGAAVANGGTVGTAYQGREATLTLAHNFTPNFTVSLEGRYDCALSNGATVSPFAGSSSNQLTTTFDTAMTF